MFNIGYQILVIIIPFITAPYLARVLGTEGVGIYSYTYSIANYFVLFSMLGLTNYGNRSIASCGDDFEKRSRLFSGIFTMQVIWSAIITVLYLIYMIAFSRRFKLIAMIQCLYVASSILDINWFFFGIEKFKLTVIRNFTIKVLTLVCIFTFVTKTNDIWKYTLIISLGTLISQSWVWFYLPQYAILTKISFNEISRHFKPNIILFIPVISYSIYRIMDKIMIGYFCTISDVGLYEYAEKVVNLPLGVISAFGTVMLPRISNLAAKNNKKQINSYISISIKYVTLVASAMAFGLIAVGKIFAPLYYGEDFTESGFIIQMLAITLIPISWANIIRTQYLIPFHKDKVYLISTVLGAIVNLIVNLVLIPNYSYNGAAIGTVTAEFTVFIVQIVGTRKEFNYCRLIGETVPFIVIGMIMLGIIKIVINTVNVSWKSLIIIIVIGTLSFLVLSAIYLFFHKKIIPPVDRSGII